MENLRQEKNIRFTRCQDNKTILHLGAERNAVKVFEIELCQHIWENNLLFFNSVFKLKASLFITNADHI